MESSAGNLTQYNITFCQFYPAMVLIHIMHSLTIPKDSTGTKQNIKLYGK